MKIVIVGGSGLISSSIVSLLLEEGHDVTCFNRGNRNEVLAKEVRFVLGDRADRAEFEKKMQSGRYDAAIDMISFTAEDAASSYRAFRDVGHFIHCSTVCTYGFDFSWMPVTEDHLLTPNTDYGRGKVAADNLLLAAYHKEGFPVTIIKPSTTYGPKIGMLRQLSRDLSWVDRVKKGKPLIVCGDGNALHQFLHADDAAKGFVGALGKVTTFGQMYNLVKPGFTTWNEYHRTAMKILGQDVELVGVPMATLNEFDAPRFSLGSDILCHHGYYSCEKICRDVPEFVPLISLEEGMRSVFEHMEHEGMIPDSDDDDWEDRIIDAQKKLVSSLKQASGNCSV